MLVIINQVDPEAQDPNFHPPFLVGDPGVLDPYTDVQISPYGITDTDSDARIHFIYNLWNKDNGISGGRFTKELPG